MSSFFEAIVTAPGAGWGVIVLARWGCPSCPPGDDQEVVGDLGLVCLRCGTRYYDGHEETS